MRELYKSNVNGFVEVLEKKGKSALIKFIDTGYQRWANIGNVKAGKVKDHSVPRETKWSPHFEIFSSNNTGSGVILAKKSKSCIIQFNSTGYTTKANIDNVRAGKVKDPYFPSVHGVGYIGEFEKVPYWRLAKQLWQNMMKRCYSDTDTRGYKKKGTTVDSRWHCFSNFLDDLPQMGNFDGWLDSKLIGVEFDLDKDTLIEGNNVYSKEACCFIPRSLNRSLGKKGKTLNEKGEWVKG